MRRLRVEKKVHTLVLLRVWGPRPGAAGAAVGGAGPMAGASGGGSSSGKITLTSPAGANLARFPARRVVFCGAYADDARFFGLVTSASTSNGSASSDSSGDDDGDSDSEGGKMLHARKNPPGEPRTVKMNMSQHSRNAEGMMPLSLSDPHSTDDFLLLLSFFCFPPLWNARANDYSFFFFLFPSQHNLRLYVVSRFHGGFPTGGPRRPRRPGPRVPLPVHPKRRPRRW